MIVSSSVESRRGPPSAAPRIAIRTEGAGVPEDLEGQERGDPIAIAVGEPPGRGVQLEQLAQDLIQRLWHEPRTVRLDHAVRSS